MNHLVDGLVAQPRLDLERPGALQAPQLVRIEIHEAARELLARLPHTRALAWGSLGTGPASALARPLPLILLALAVLAYRPVSMVPRPRTAALLARLPWIVALAIAADAVIAEPLGVRWLPADRIADGGWMALVLAAGLGASQLLRRLSALSSRGPPAVSP